MLFTTSLLRRDSEEVTLAFKGLPEPVENLLERRVFIGDSGGILIARGERFRRFGLLGLMDRGA